MTEEIDIWHATNLLTKRHGPDVEIVTTQRTDEFLDRHDRVASVGKSFLTRRLDNGGNPRMSAGWRRECPPFEQVFRLPLNLLAISAIAFPRTFP